MRGVVDIGEFAGGSLARHSLSCGPSCSVGQSAGNFTSGAERHFAWRASLSSASTLRSLVFIRSSLYTRANFLLIRGHRDYARTGYAENAATYDRQLERNGIIRGVREVREISRMGIVYDAE